MPIFSPDQISEALFEVDPFNTGCKENDRQDAYGDAPRGAYAQQLGGLTVKEALICELVEWFFAHERITTNCLDPVVEYLHRKEDW